MPKLLLTQLLSLFLFTFSYADYIRKFGVFNKFNINTVCGISPTIKYCNDNNLLFNINDNQDIYLSNVFPNTKIIIFNQCSEIFIQNNFQPDIFPSLKTVIFCHTIISRNILNAFDTQNINFYTTSVYDRQNILDSNIFMRKINSKDYTNYLKTFLFIEPNIVQLDI